MHRVILGETNPEVCIDHQDGDGLNNRRCNLRRCTNEQNSRNQRAHRNKRTSAFKGVYRMADGQFRAHITVHYKKFNLGNYPTQEAAAEAYDKAARKLHGEFARLNKPNFAPLSEATR